MPAYERKDATYRRAKKEGYRSRAAYKLLALDAQFKILRAGQRVVDIGCWPGAWMQVASERIGATGRVVGVDLLPTEDLGRPNARALVGDITDPTVRVGIAEALHGSADVVLADLAPKLSGIAATDSVRHAGLVEAALEAAVGWLAPEGTFVAKLFMDSEYQALVTRLRAAFRSVKTRRPETTRRGSAEIYAVCRELRG